MLMKEHKDLDATPRLDIAFEHPRAIAASSWRRYGPFFDAGVASGTAFESGNTTL